MRGRRRARQPTGKWGDDGKVEVIGGIRGLRRYREQNVDRTRKRKLEVEAIVGESDYSPRPGLRDEEGERGEPFHERDSVIDALREEVRRLRDQVREQSDELGERIRSRHSI